MLPSQTYLGSLRIIEVYEYHDKPVLFACLNNTDQLFLVVQVEEDDDSDIWLYVALSKARFESIRTGQIDLYAAFKEAESGFVYQVQTFHHSLDAEIDSLKADDLVDDQLPAQREFLHIEAASLAGV